MTNSRRKQQHCSGSNGRIAIQTSRGSRNIWQVYANTYSYIRRVTVAYSITNTPEYLVLGPGTLLWNYTRSLKKYEVHGKKLYNHKKGRHAEDWTGDVIHTRTASYLSDMTLWQNCLYLYVRIDDLIFWPKKRKKKHPPQGDDASTA